MKLKSVSIRGLNYKVDCDFEFHNDINIVTGINGCGKTTFLKILWYAISGNIERIISEIRFESLNLITTHYSLCLSRENNIINWKYNANGIEQSEHVNLDLDNYLVSIKFLKSLIIGNKTASCFFPTFRRIEGGYSIVNQTIVPNRSTNIPIPFIKTFSDPSSLLQKSENITTNIKDELDKLSNLLSIDKNRFVCSLSTNDLGDLLGSRHTQIVEKIDQDSLTLNQSLIGKLENIKSDIADSKDKSLDMVNKLQQELKNIRNKRDELLQPFTVLSELVVKILHYKGIRFNWFSIGDPTYAIDPKSLSYGEQQMLSFLCYNACYEDSVIFIDEPELSLHPDWQRILFPQLMKQQSSNQFIVATHSPFIYSNYEDKEIILDGEKGE